MPTQLPPKENTLFKRILKCYEQKQYKNGLKFCKQILTNTKFAEHGETLAMKGLTLNCLGRKEEAYDFVRKGLRNDLKSHVCWHVYGLLQRSDRKYDEAIKCYRNALKWDKDNIQILRDLSLLQIQMRDLDGFRETRYQLLKLRPAQRQSWIGYSISHYLLEDHELALQIMEEYRKTQYLENQLTKSSLDFEHSEMLLYQNMIHRENGRAKEALDHLDKYEKHITDKLQVKELKANLYLQIGNNQAAERIYRDLLKRNPENWSYYEKLEACLKPETEQDRAEIYLHYRRIFPRVEAPKRLSLNFVTGETFKRFADEYLRNALRKGVPPLFVNLRGLYRDYGKATIFAKIIQGYIHNLETQSKFSESDQCKEDPTVLLWTYFFAAQHYDQQRKIDVALEYINKVLEHTPTLIEGYMVKARIYKHAGCSGEAVRWMDEGRSLDTADRYVNSKCAKYLLRNNQIKKSEEICGLFTREGIPANENLDEMQCMWFLTECARAHQRLGDIGEALKKCHQIDRIFSEIIEDQFDFHTYCMRKVTLTAYIRLLRLEDILRSHPFYFRAAKVALECYIRLYDKPYQEGDKDDDLNKGNLTAQELKKIKSKQRRAKKKAQREEEKKANENKENKETEKKEEKKERFDANVLVKTETPLEDAMKFLVPLQLLAKERLETHLFAFEIYFRKGKPLLMLQSIKRAIKIEPNNHKLHECIIRFVKTVNDSREKYNKVVISVLDKEMPAFVTHEDLATYNTEYLMKHKHSFACRISVAKMDYHLDHSKKDDAVHVLTDLSDNCSLEDCTTVYNLLNDGYVDDCESTLEEYKIACHNRFPLADVFQPEKSRDEKENAKNDAHLNMNGESHLVDGEIDGPLDDTMYP